MGDPYLNSNSFHASQNSHGFKLKGMNKYGTNKEGIPEIGNSNKIWSRKLNKALDEKLHSIDRKSTRLNSSHRP